MMVKAETMLHPMSGVRCSIKHLEPGELIETGDVYRSESLKEKGTELGRWYVVEGVLAGTPIGKECNVHFMRLTPIDG